MSDEKTGLERLVFEALGRASMCWQPIPSGVFESTKAKEIGERLVAALLAEERARKPAAPAGLWWDIQHYISGISSLPKYSIIKENLEEILSRYDGKAQDDKKGG